MPTLTIQTLSTSYPVVIDEFLHNDTCIISQSKALIVSNPKVAGLYLHKVLPKIQAQEVFVCIVPDGEEHKNMQSIEQILQCAFANRLDRKSLMIALGGGVISDMVGFASGIFERGISYVSIPTTLLAQVDASVGGKCGVNNAYGKNLIGLFHQPSAVYIDKEFLRTLSTREIKAGLAEVLKIFVCFDEQAFTKLEMLESPESKDAFLDSSALLPLIQRSIEIKAKVVEQDERESGIRAALNYGHTFAHIIEMQTHYKRFLHGQAVAIGIAMANTLAQQLGSLSAAESKRISTLLARFGLDESYHIDDIEAFYQAFFLDKKSHSNKLCFILPEGIGGFSLRDDISKEQIIACLQHYAR
ncbi:3-dehydroquinate synthase [Helicobacter canis]|uniref:3-dehydroquinate synthase n=1 Tax=Helicobacter canis TaxID=29419 RepID=A0A5M9QLE5_9HELI|nr:3-dehydroquinate synthase [Helicobacter canis]KAA8709070.1 3-dehydroquinate synthase [Helicobacter canis]